MSKLFKTMSFTVLTVMLAALGSHFAEAKGKPGGDGGGGTADTGGGTIYFRKPDGLNSMDSNGGFKTALGIDFGEPSYALHGGQRWFLQIRQLPGEFYPNGSTRRELFAVPGDGGQAVQLTDQPSLEVRSQGYRWTPGDLDQNVPGDQNVSWTARRWETTTDPMTGQTVFTGDMIAGGIYGAGVSFELDDPVLLSQPADPLVALELIETRGVWEASANGPTLAPNVNTHSWSPLAALVVYDLLDSQVRELWIANPEGGAHFPLSSNGVNPEWSPDGSKIAYTGFDGIETINWDGTNRKAIISQTAMTFIGPPHWSPTGSHLTYFVNVHKLQGPIEGSTYVYRATATGGGKTNLTSDSNSASPVGWR